MSRNSITYLPLLHCGPGMPYLFVILDLFCYLLVFYIFAILWLIRNPRQESTPRYCLTANSQTLLPENAPQKGGAAAKQGQSCPACRPGGPGSISIFAEQAVGPLGKVRLVSSDRRVLIPTPRKGSFPPWGIT